MCYDDGSAKMWGDTNSANFTHLEGGNDSGIELLYTFDENKNLTGIVANADCPAQVVEHRSFISSDYWGKVKNILRKKFGEHIFLLPLCSAAGDQCPRDMIRWVNPETPIDDPNIKRENYIERDADPSMFDIKGTWTVGRRIAAEIICAYDEISEYHDSGMFLHKTFLIDLPVRRVTIAEYEEAVKAIKQFAGGQTAGLILQTMQKCMCMQARWNGMNISRSITFTAWRCISFGSAISRLQRIHLSCFWITVTKSVREAVRGKPS